MNGPKPKEQATESFCRLFLFCDADVARYAQY